MTTMQLKRHDMVKLLPSWPLPQSPAQPIWGGTYGYHLGRVLKVQTADHDQTKHFAEVEFSPGHKCTAFPESALQKASDAEIEISSEFVKGNGYGRDIWALVKTNAGGFVLNVIETNPFGDRGGNTLSRFVVGLTKTSLKSTDNSDYNLINSMLSSPGYRETKVASIYSGLMHIHSEWQLPDPDPLPLPLHEYPSIRSAIADCPSKGPALAYFHLPNDLYDYTDETVMERESKKKDPDLLTEEEWKKQHEQNKPF